MSGKLKTIPGPADRRRSPKTRRRCACCRRRRRRPTPKTVLQAGGLDALERLRHRPAAAGRPEGAPRPRSRESRRSTPKNPDGWVNIGRVRVQEGDIDGARDGAGEGAGARSGPGARATTSMSRVLRAEGNYDGARRRTCGRCIAQYPRDRVVRNDLGRMLFLQRKYARRSSSSSDARRSIPRTCRRTTT